MFGASLSSRRSSQTDLVTRKRSLRRDLPCCPPQSMPRRLIRSRQRFRAVGPLERSSMIMMCWGSVFIGAVGECSGICPGSGRWRPCRIPSSIIFPQFGSPALRRDRKPLNNKRIVLD